MFECVGCTYVYYLHMPKKTDASGVCEETGVTMANKFGVPMSIYSCLAFHTFHSENQIQANFQSRLTLIWVLSRRSVRLVDVDLKGEGCMKIRRDGQRGGGPCHGYVHNIRFQ